MEGSALIEVLLCRRAEQSAGCAANESHLAYLQYMDITEGRKHHVSTDVHTAFEHAYGQRVREAQPRGCAPLALPSALDCECTETGRTRKGNEMVRFS